MRYYRADMASTPAVRVATTAQLFDDDEEACDGCGDLLDEPHDDEEEPTRYEGALLWVRGDTRREERRLLCPACAQAIGVTARTRWAEEEEEG